MNTSLAYHVSEDLRLAEVLSKAGDREQAAANLLDAALDRLERGEREAGQALLRRALQIQPRAFGPEHVDRLSTRLDPTLTLKIAMQAARILLLERDLEPAALILCEVLRHEPGHVEALTALADLELQRGRPETARLHLARAHHVVSSIEQDPGTSLAARVAQLSEPGDPRTLRLRAAIRLRKDDPRGAMTELTRLLAERPHDALGRELMCYCLLRLGQERAATAVLKLLVYDLRGRGQQRAVDGLLHRARAWRRRHPGPASVAAAG